MGRLTDSQHENNRAEDLEDGAVFFGNPFLRILVAVRAMAVVCTQ